MFKKNKSINWYEKEDIMVKPVSPFKDVSSQKIFSLILMMLSIFMIFYTPMIILFKIGNFQFTHTLLGILIFLVAMYYLLKALE